jgi:hypothetical protein
MMALITVVKILKSTDKAHMAIMHFDDPMRFTMAWFPKSCCREMMEPYWDIPASLKRDISRQQWWPARQYVDDRFGNDGIECYAYGTPSTGFYNRDGKEIHEKDLIDT